VLGGVRFFEEVAGQVGKNMIRLRWIKNYCARVRFRLRLKAIGVRIGSNCVLNNVDFIGPAIIEPYCRIFGDPRIRIGKNFYANVACHFQGEIQIGDDVQIGPKTVIWGRDHGIAKNKLIREQAHIRAPIVIGDDVWIGANCAILKGVTIAKGVVIGAGSVVTRDIPEYGIAVGNPARVIRYRK
jgi:acetyltransferase-like isoleucine patch superfamily enzyme